MSDEQYRAFKLIHPPTFASFASSATDCSLPSNATSEQSDYESGTSDDESELSPHLDNILLRRGQDKDNLKSVWAAGYRCDTCARRANDRPPTTRLVDGRTAEPCENCGKLFLEHYGQDKSDPRLEVCLAIDSTKASDDAFSPSLAGYGAGLGFHELERLAHDERSLPKETVSRLTPHDERDTVLDTSTTAADAEAPKHHRKPDNNGHIAGAVRVKVDERVHTVAAQPPSRPRLLDQAACGTGRKKSRYQPTVTAPRRARINPALTGIGSVFTSSSELLRDSVNRGRQSPTFSPAKSRRLTSDSGNGSVRIGANLYRGNTLPRSGGLPGYNPILGQIDHGGIVNQADNVTVLSQEHILLPVQRLTLETRTTGSHSGLVDRSMPRSLGISETKLDAPGYDRTAQSSRATSPSPQYTCSPNSPLSPIITTPRTLPKLLAASADSIRSRPNTQPPYRGVPGPYLGSGLHSSSQYLSGFQHYSDQNNFDSSSQNPPPKVVAVDDGEQPDLPSQRFDCPARKERPQYNNCCTKDGFENASRVKLVTVELVFPESHPDHSSENTLDANTSTALAAHDAGRSMRMPKTVIGVLRCRRTATFSAERLSKISKSNTNSRTSQIGGRSYSHCLGIVSALGHLTVVRHSSPQMACRAWRYLKMLLVRTSQ
jgi:hypothetical protein